MNPTTLNGLPPLNLNILKKLHTIMSEVGTLSKDKKNDFQNYKYLSEAAIKSAVQPLLIKHGVVFTVSSESYSGNGYLGLEEDGDQKKKGKVRTITLSYRFYDIVSGEFIQGTMEGDGADSGDKGVYKAVTGAIKYIMTSTFLIPTNDDPEVARKDEEKKEVKPYKNQPQKAVKDDIEIFPDEPPFQKGKDEDDLKL